MTTPATSAAIPTSFAAAPQIDFVIGALERFGPVIVEVADKFGLNKLAADLLRHIVADLVAAAAKTATPIDDILMKFVAATLLHVADNLERGAVKEALALLAALSKLLAR